MNPPREDQSAGQETVHAETTGGPAPPIRTQTGLPADRAKLRDRGEHRSQVPEARRGGGRRPGRCPRIGMKRGWKRRCSRAGSHRSRRHNPARITAGLRRDPRAVAQQQVRDFATAVGGIPAGQPGRLSLLALLRAVPALAFEARRGAAAGAQSGREDVRRLGGRDDSGLRPAHRPSLAGAVVRGRAGRQLLHLGRGHARSADGIVAARARARLRALSAAFRRWRFPTTPRPA